MDYTCLPDMIPSPGVSLPRGDTEVLAGSEPLNLTCHLNPDHPEYLSGVRATDLAFQSNLTILKSSILNATSISSMFSPMVEGVTDLSCIILSDNTVNRPLNKGVCTQRILVGHPPADISKFSCVSENWQSLNCTWSEPANPVPTKYDVHFTTPGTWAGFKRCPSMRKIESLLKLSSPPNLNMCYFNYRTIPQYRHVTKQYHFFFNVTNSLSPDGTVYHHTVDHFSVVRPGPATQLSLASPTPSTVQVSWSISKEMRHFPPGLRQLVRYRSEWSSPHSWADVDTSQLNTTHNSYSLSLPGTILPYSLYTVEVAMITNLPTTPPSLHSTPVQVSERTKPAPPTRPPRTTLAGFEVLGGAGPVSIVLIYWQSLQPWEHYGPQFGYQVTLVGGEQFSLTPVPAKVTSCYAQFENLPSENTFSFSIASINSAGISPPVVTASVPTYRATTSLLPRSVTKIYEEDDIFTLSWLPPLSSEDVTSYTLFWCNSTSGRDRPYQCEGYLEWKTITTDQLNGSLSHSLLLPMESTSSRASTVYQLAVAANTATLSSGMQWSTCTVKNDMSVSTRVTDVTVDALSDGSVDLRWRLDCSMITGLVNSFVVEFCEVEPEGGSCQPGTIQTVLRPAGQTRLLVEQLTPYSFYQFTISVRDGVSPIPGSNHLPKTGPPSSPVTIQTVPAPPGSPPGGLAVNQVTSSRATLGWDQPSKPNGEICKYLVELSKEDMVPVSRTIETAERVLVVSNLTSYSSYQVSVAACSVSSTGVCQLCSMLWARKEFSTLVGTPGKATSPLVRLVNSSVVEVEWDLQFQLGASSVAAWYLRVSRGGDDGDESQFAVMSSKVTRLGLDLTQVVRQEGWESGCDNSSVYVEYYAFSVRAQVVNSEGDIFTGPWSDQTVQAVYCTPALPWVMLVLGTTLILVIVLCLAATLYCSCSWYMAKKVMIKKIGRGLDNREIVPVVIPPTAEHELGQLQAHYDSELEDGQCTVLLRTHKNSASSDDSGVCSLPPASPPHPGYTRGDSGVSGMSGCSRQDSGGSDSLGYTRQDSGVSGVARYTRQSNSLASEASGYISMGLPSAPQSPVAASSPGYCVVGQAESQAYVPLTTIKQINSQTSPGYVSLGQVRDRELVLQPVQPHLVSGAYSRVGKEAVCTGCTGPGMPGVARLKEEKCSDEADPETRKARTTTCILDTVPDRNAPFTGNFTCV